MPESRTWFITGCSSGLGYALADQLLARGDRVVVTARVADTLRPLLQGRESNALAVALDVTSPEQTISALAAARERFGPIDVLVNNAGYGHVGSVEEMPLDGVRAVFETNFFASYRLLQAVLPEMRARRRGWIVNIASVTGLVPTPMASAYCSAKAAVMALTDALHGEVGHLGIKLTVVEPGPIDTDFAGRSMVITPPATSDYDFATAFARGGFDTWQGTGNNPSRGAAAIIAALDQAEPPLHLLLGALALDLARREIVKRQNNYEKWASITLSSDMA